MKRGITLLEMLVVVGVIAIISAALIPQSQEDISLERLSTESKSLAHKFLELSVDARVSGKTYRLTCNPQTIVATSYSANQSWDYDSAVLKTSGVALETQTLFQARGGLSLNGYCAGNQTFYISSEGNLFVARNTPGITGLEIRTRRYAASMDISGTGYPRSIRIGNIGAIPIDNEI